MGIVVILTIFGISMLIFGENSWVPAVAGVVALILGGFIATYFTKNKKISYGTYVGVILAVMLLILGLGTFTVNMSIGIFVFLLVITSVGGFFGKILAENNRQTFKTGLKDLLTISKIKKILENEYRRSQAVNYDRQTFKTEYKNKNSQNKKSPKNVIYCPQCGLKDSNSSKLCADCGENLETGRRYLKITQFLLYFSVALFLMFFVSLIIADSGVDTGDYSLFTIPILFLILASIPMLLGKLILPRFNGHIPRYCPKCEHSDFNEKYCIKCGYNLENVLGCFSCNLGVDLYDIEFNKNYINLYRHII
ncbi:MAG: YrzE family protein, partial [Methanobacterium paludis]|nr:YrzE family protein [Methanobacterium paludis]